MRISMLCVILMSYLPIHVLIIEEHPFKQLVASQVFQEAGCDGVLTVADVASALDLIDRTGPVDIALCSLKEGCTQGLTAIEALSRSNGIKSIIICSHHTPYLHDAIECWIGLLGVKVLGYIDTPVRAATIVPMLTRYMETGTVLKRQILGNETYQKLSKERLEHAIDNGEIKPFFQPKFNLITGELGDFEVLARWEHPKYGLLCPTNFIPQLKRFDLMHALFFAQLEQGLAFMQEAQVYGHMLSLSFNLESVQLSCNSLVSRLEKLLAFYAIPASRLTFEITESGLLEVSPTTLESLIRLRMMGAGLSIDDFGIGYSSLERLCQLPFTEIKLDAAFARDLETNTRNVAVISSTLALGSALDMQVVVEGVENEIQRQRLITLGCSKAQGYLCARPMSTQHVLSWIEMNLNSRTSI